MVAAVGVGFALAMVGDHVEDDLAEIFAAVNAPFGQNGDGHRPVGFQGVTAQAVEQLGGADIADLVSGTAAGAAGEIEGFADEEVGLGVKARVGGDDFFDGLLESQGLHIRFFGRGGRRRRDGRRARF